MDGKDRLLAAHRLSHYPLVIAVTTDVDAALASWRNERNLLIGAGAFSVLAITIVFLLIVRQLSRGHRWSKQRLALEKLRLDTAINNMSQGLLLFDASERIVICNQRYIRMYGLSPDVVKPGCAFRDLILHRKQAGTFTGDIDEYRSSLIRDLAQGKPVSSSSRRRLDVRFVSSIIRWQTAVGWRRTRISPSPEVPSRNATAIANSWI